MSRTSNYDIIFVVHYIMFYVSRVRMFISAHHMVGTRVAETAVLLSAASESSFE